MTLICCTGCGELLDASAPGGRCACHEERIEVRTDRRKRQVPTTSTFAEVAMLATLMSLQTGRPLGQCVRAASVRVRGRQRA